MSTNTTTDDANSIFRPNGYQVAGLIYVIITILIIITIIFEMVKDWAVESCSKYTRPITLHLISEMTLIGFLSLVVFLFIDSGASEQWSIALFGSNAPQYLESRVTDVEYSLFLVLLIIAIQAKYIVDIGDYYTEQYEHYNLMSQKKALMVPFLKEMDNRPQISYASWTYDYITNPVAAWDTHSRRVETEEIVIFYCLRQEAILRRSPLPPYKPERKDRQLPANFDYGSYMSLCMSKFLSEVVTLTPATWLAMFLFIVLVYGVVVACGTDYVAVAMIWMAAGYLGLAMLLLLEETCNDMLQHALNPAHLSVDDVAERTQEIEINGDMQLDLDFDSVSNRSDTSGRVAQVAPKRQKAQQAQTNRLPVLWSSDEFYAEEDFQKQREALLQELAVEDDSASLASSLPSNPSEPSTVASRRRESSVAFEEFGISSDMLSGPDGDHFDFRSPVPQSDLNTGMTAETSSNADLSFNPRRGVGFRRVASIESIASNSTPTSPLLNPTMMASHRHSIKKRIQSLRRTHTLFKMGEANEVNQTAHEAHADGEIRPAMFPDWSQMLDDDGADNDDGGEEWQQSGTLDDALEGGAGITPAGAASPANLTANIKKTTVRKAGFFERVVVDDVPPNIQEKLFFGGKMGPMLNIFLVRYHLFCQSFYLMVVVVFFAPLIFEDYGWKWGMLYLLVALMPIVVQYMGFYARMISQMVLISSCGCLVDAEAQKETRKLQKMQQVIRLMLMLTKVSQERKRAEAESKSKENSYSSGGDGVGAATASRDIYSDDLDPALIAEMEEVARIFDKYDRNGDGELDLNEMRPLLGSLGLSLDEYGLEKLFIIIDSDGSGTCSKDELLTWRLEKFYEDNPEEMAKNLYLMFVGKIEDDIPVQQFKEVLLSFNDPPYDAKLSKEEVHMIVDEFDEDGSGYITFDEFLHAIKTARNME